MTSAVLIACMDVTAAASFAEIRARRRFGMAIAAIIRIIATTISNSIRENPFGCFALIGSVTRNSIREVSEIREHLEGHSFALAYISWFY